MREDRQRVAQGWFGKLLDRIRGRPDGQVREPARAPQQIFEQAYGDVKDVLVRAIRSEIPRLVKATTSVAQRHRIDPVFLNWFLLNGAHWPALQSRERRALQTMQSIHLWFGAVPDDWAGMRVPRTDEANARDAALRDLARWFLTDSLARIERKYTNALWEGSRGISKTDHTDPSLVLMQVFEARLRGDRFQLKPAVQKVVDLFE